MEHRDKALDRLIADLDKAAVVEPGDGYNAERLAAAIALHGAISYLTEMGVGLERRGVLFRLLNGLRDLDEGTVIEMLEPKNLGYRGPIPTTTQAVRAWAAAMMDCLMLPSIDGAKGLSREVAARRVARAIKDWPVKARGAPSWRQVAGWRDVANAEQGQGHVDTEVYRAIRAYLARNDIEPGAAFTALMKSHVFK